MAQVHDVTFIYMNERIRQKRPSKGVIRVQEMDGRGGVKSVVDGNRVDIYDRKGTIVASVVYDPKNNPSPTHEVKAWVQVYGTAVRVRES